MPKIPAYTLAWLPARVTYELYETHARKALPIALDSPAWFTWLESASSFAFVGQNDRYTVRKEAKSGGRLYWYAYLAREDHLLKKYVGKTSALPLARLE